MTRQETLELTHPDPLKEARICGLRDARAIVERESHVTPNDNFSVKDQKIFRNRISEKIQRLITEVEHPDYVPGDAERSELNQAQARTIALETAIRNLIEDAMPENWHELDELAPNLPGAWRAAMVAVGIDPEMMKGEVDA